jgi:hypothetical protein
MQKVFSLEPSNFRSVKEFQFLLNEGYEVIHITAAHITSSAGGHSYSFESREGKIVYILEKKEK